MFDLLVICEEPFVLEACAAVITNACFLLKYNQVSEINRFLQNMQNHLFHPFVGMSEANVMLQLYQLLIPFVTIATAILRMRYLQVF